MRWISSVVSLFAALSCCGPTFAASGDQIGSAVAIQNIVTAEFEKDSRQLQIGDNVRQDELIEVGTDALGELELKDETKLALGPGSRLVLDKFVYDAERPSGSIVLNLVRGSFRFITGVAAKPTYVIRTPNASITVRGTIFDIYVQDNGMAWLLLISGSIRACNDRGVCRNHNEPGKLIRITEAGDVGVPVKWAGLPDNNKVPFDTAFPFMVNAPQVDPNPIFTRDAIVLGHLPETPKETRKPQLDKPSGKKTERKRKDGGTKQTAKNKTTRSASTKGGSSAVPKILDGLNITIGIGGGFGGKRGDRPRHKRSPNKYD